MMDEDILQKVLERAFSDQLFRTRLEAGLDEALDGGGYKLTSDQRRQLKGILEEGRDTFATGLDQRVSQSGVSLSPQDLLRQKSKASDRQGELLRHTQDGSGRRQRTRQVPANENPFTGDRQDQGGHTGTIDDQEPDYEVETG